MLSVFVNIADAAVISTSDRTVTTSKFFIDWSNANPNNPEEIDVINWPVPRSGANYTNFYGSPPGEFFSNSFAINAQGYGLELVGSTSKGTWGIGEQNQVVIQSNTSGSSQSSKIPVTTTYTFYDEGPESDMISINRSFQLNTALNYLIRPYILRLYPTSSYRQVLHPTVKNTLAVTDVINNNCGSVCGASYWDSSKGWFAIHDPSTGKGVILLREPSLVSGFPWIDWDAWSNTNASSFYLPAPAGGFQGLLTESYALCFYDNTTWTQAMQNQLQIPNWCRTSHQQPTPTPTPTQTPTPSPTPTFTPTPTPARQIEFIHGIKTNYRDVLGGRAGFQSLIQAIPQNNLDVFSYYQDLGYKLPDNSGCGILPPDGQMPTPQPTPDTRISPLYAPPDNGINHSTNPDTCDSQGAIAYNSTKLAHDISQLSSPVTIIAYSMGAPSVRGWLTLAQNNQDKTILNKVDTLITIQGAHQGSYLPLGFLPLLNAASWIDPVWEGVITGAELVTGWNKDRPAEQDLTPRSNWYQQANNTDVPANIHYFNFYSDIQVTARPQLFFIKLPPVGTASFGDTVILPQDNPIPNPSPLPLLGGSRFLPGGVQTSDHHEYPVASNHDLLLGDDIMHLLLPNPFSIIGATAAVLSDPRIHTELPNHLDDDKVLINSCKTPYSQVTLQYEILRILANPAQACDNGGGAQ